MEQATMESTVTDPSPRERDARTVGSEALPVDNSGERLTIAGYVIERELGRGGMGVVYQARQISLNRTVALKMILAGGHAGQTDLDRFRTEAEAIASLQHPNIVQIHEIGEHDGLPYFSLEFCNGGSLDQQLKVAPLQPQKSAHLVETLARAMQVAHDKGIIHRDLKPANVLLADDGIVKVTDFGLARKLDEAAKTATGAILGTPSYMAPEQAGGSSKDLGPACDIYALGAILYECLTGQPPFRAANPFDTLLQVIGDEPVSLVRLNRQVPRDLETICLKCLRKEPTRRYVSASALAEDLQRFQTGQPIHARAVGVVERGVKWVRRNRVVSSLATAVFLALSIGLLAALLERERANQEARTARLAEATAEENLQTANTEKTRAEAEKRRAEIHLMRAEGLVYAGKLVQAQQAFQEGNGALALQYLNESAWNRRGWEHDHLWTRFTSNQTLRGHTGPVTCVAFSPDGKRIVSSSDDLTIRVWDAETGQELFALKGHQLPVACVTFSPDGKRLASAGGDRPAEVACELKVWDVEKRTELLNLKGHRSVVDCIVYSPDGKRLATGSWDKTAKVWDAETGKELLTLKGHIWAVGAIAWSPDGKQIGTGGRDNKVKVWDADKGTELHSWDAHFEPVLGVSFSPDGKRLATSSEDMTARVWNVPQQKALLTLQGHTNSVQSVEYSPDGRYLLTAGVDGRMKLWDAITGEGRGNLLGHTGALAGASFSPDGRRIVSGSWDMTVKVWDAERRQEPLTLRGHRRSVLHVCYSPDGKRIVTAGDDRLLNLWDAEKGVLLVSREHEGANIERVAFSPDGKRFVTSDDNKGVKLWDAEKLTVLLARADTHAVQAVAIRPDGQQFVSAGNNVIVWDAMKGEQVHSPAFNGARAECIAYSPNGRLLGIGNVDGSVHLCDSDTGAELFKTKGHTEDVRAIAFSPDGKRFVTASYDRTLKVWETASGRLLKTLTGHTNYVVSVVYNREGTRIFSGSWDQSVKVWDAQTGQELAILKGHTGSVYSVALRPDGKHLVSGSSDMTAKIWTAERTQTVFTLSGHTRPVERAAFSADDKRLYAWDDKNNLLAWSLDDGQLTEPLDPPEIPEPGAAQSRNGFLRAEGRDTAVILTDTRLSDSDANRWALPDRAERLRYHGEQAVTAEQQKNWFAVAFHVGRLLLDQPDNAELKRRREEAIQQFQGMK